MVWSMLVLVIGQCVGGGCVIGGGSGFDGIVPVDCVVGQVRVRSGIGWSAGTGVLVGAYEGVGGVELAFMTARHVCVGVGRDVEVRFWDGVSEVVGVGRVYAVGSADVGVVGVRVIGYVRPCSVVRVSGEGVRVGERVWWCGLGGGRLKVKASRVTGLTADGDYILEGGAVGGDSGGPVLDSDGELVGVVWGTDGTRTIAVSHTRLVGFLEGRYVFPWNSWLKAEEGRIALEGQKVQGGQSNASIAGLEGLRGDLQALGKALSDLSNQVNGLNERVKGLEAAVGGSGKVEEEPAASGGGDSGAVGFSVPWWVWLFGTGGLIIVLVLFIVRDIRQRRLTGDPLEVEKWLAMLAARTPNKIDDYLVEIFSKALDKVIPPQTSNKRK